ncbi:MAG TPA: hypothetical protein VGX24_10520 [Pyrinomonadaceae bacterium]|jgi:hypothetical protein|nr:hypothetical protein [Pyrinomonadaceae bacterium]
MSSNAKKPSKKQGERPLTAALRTPVAPHGHPLTRAKPEERAHPAERKVKHKRRAGEDG